MSLRCVFFCMSREVLDGFLRERAESNGTTVINGLFLRMDIPSDDTTPYTIHYSDYAENAKVKETLHASNKPFFCPYSSYSGHDEIDP